MVKIGIKIKLDVNFQYVVLIIMFGTILTTIISYPIENEFEINCNLGKLDLNSNYKNYVENYTQFRNMTHFKQTLLLDKLRIGNIENINCKIMGKSNIPSWLMLNILNRD